MELATDIMAIIGWAMIGFLFPAWISVKTNYAFSILHSRFSFISFGLIAASYVLG